MSNNLTRATAAVDVPRETDIICERGNHHSHQGNEMYRKLIKDQARAYEDAKSTTDKNQIILRIKTELDRVNTRFIARDTTPGKWTIIIDEKRIRTKICQSLRDARNLTKNSPIHGGSKKPKKHKAEKQNEIGGLVLDPPDEVRMPHHSQCGVDLQESQMLENPFSTEHFCQDPPNVQAMKESNERLIRGIKNEILLKNRGLS